MGTLYVVATPIGNLEDITLRALRVLGEVDLIAAEDTRRTQILLRRHSIKTPTLSYHEHNKERRIDSLLTALEGGSVALVSDAGTPGLSDPGYLLVNRALQAGHQVTPIPGPSAPVAALVASGLPADNFVFVGYLPRKRALRQRALQELSVDPRTVVLFEVPHRLLESLADLESAFGPERPAALCRELTKQHEQILRARLGEIRERLGAAPPKGEVTLVIGGAPSPGRWEEERVRRALTRRLEQGMRPAEAVREVAHESGWARKAIYQMTLEER